MKGRVLFIDDNVLDLKVGTQLLKTEGFDVVTFENPLEALKWSLDQSLQLILLDLQMPGINGFDMIQRFKSLPMTKKTPIIILSGRNQTEDVKKAVDLGATDYIVKPIDPLVVMEKLRKLSETVEEFAEIGVDQETLKGAFIKQNVQVVGLSEFGISVFSSQPIELGKNLEIAGIASEILTEKSVLVRSLSCIPLQQGGYKVQFTFVGLTESQRSQIRKKCRQIYIEQRAKETG